MYGEMLEESSSEDEASGVKAKNSKPLTTKKKKSYKSTNHKHETIIAIKYSKCVVSLID